MAKKTLVIVESPAKSQTISKYLGDDFVISSSMGHVRDLPAAVLGIDLKNNYKPCYEELPGKAQVIKELRKLAKGAAKIFLASDPDREGEAIAFHLQQILQKDNKHIFRVLFNEITRPSILAAVEKPLAIDGNKVDSQQMRRLLDRLAGYKISPVLQRKIGGPLSAGRVQSIALKLIVEREKEIRAFVSEEFWTIAVDLLGSRQPPFTSKLEKFKGKNIKIPDKSSCERVLAELKLNEYVLERMQKKLRKRKAPPPLITSTLQQDAFRRFKFPVKKTMQLAQQLYEGLNIHGGETTGLITYMRTDSFRVADQARDQAREYIAAGMGKEYLPVHPERVQEKSQDPGCPRMHPAHFPFPCSRRHQGRPEPRAVEDLPADLGEVFRFADGRRGDRGDPVRRQERLLSVRLQGRDREIQGLPGHAEERQRADDPAAAAGKGDPAAAQDRRQAEFHQAAGPLQRSLPGQGARGKRHRPPFHLRQDHRNPEQAGIRLQRGKKIRAHRPGHQRGRVPGREFPGHHELQFHRRPGKRARPGRRRQARLGGRDRPVL